MRLAEVEALLGTAYDSFKRTEWSIAETLAFDDFGVFVVLHPERGLTSVSLFLRSEARIFGLTLIGLPFDDAVEQIGRHLQLEKCDVGFCCESAGIVLVEVEDTLDAIELEFRM